MRNYLIFLSFLLSFWVSVSMAETPKENSFKLLSKDPYWQKLYYYQKKRFGGFESLADNKEFFFHKLGKTNPLLEVKASFKAFKKIEKKVIEWRHDIHENPELSNREFKTAEKIAKHVAHEDLLDALGHREFL